MRKKTLSDESREKLFDIEVSLYLNQEDMGEIAAKLTVLDRLQKDLIYNIDLHKSGLVVTSIDEYKKTLKDLKKTREEIEKILKLQKKIEDSINKLVAEHERYNTQYEQISAFEEKTKVVKMEDYAKNRRNKKKNNE
jgi:DNA repair ATPase RecN